MKSEWKGFIAKFGTVLMTECITQFLRVPKELMMCGEKSYDLKLLVVNNEYFFTVENE